MSRQKLHTSYYGRAQSKGFADFSPTNIYLLAGYVKGYSDGDNKLRLHESNALNTDETTTRVARSLSWHAPL